MTADSGQGLRLPGARVLLRPVEDRDVEDLKRIHDQPEVARWWEKLEVEDETWPFDDYGETKFTIEVDGKVAGLIQYLEEEEPKYRHASMDLFLGAEFHSRGLGSEAVRTLARYLISERGHHRLEIDPNVDNIAAIKAYTKVGFKYVGVLRRSERDAISGEWTDGYMMDMLAEELT